MIAKKEIIHVESYAGSIPACFGPPQQEQKEISQT
jgi:hypothetical protein